MIAATVALAGAFGAVARYLVDGLVQDRSRGEFPFGTLAVNVSGSLLLGVITGLAWYHGLGGSAKAVLGVGLCGAFTTWSTVTWETVRLSGDGRRGLAGLALLGGLAAALAAAAAGVALAALL